MSTSIMIIYIIVSVCNGGQCVPECGANNTKLANCKSVCPKSCQNFNQPQCQAIKCGQESCVCDEGFVFKNGSNHALGCVKPTDCYPLST